MPIPSQDRTIGWFRIHARPISVMLLLAFTLEACVRWVPRLEPPATIGGEGPERWIRVTLSNGRELSLRDAHVVGTSLASATDTIPLADIRATEVGRRAVARTVLLIAGLGVTAILVAGIGSGPSAKPAPSPPPTTISCPVVYSWNGSDWILDSGTFGGAIARAFQRTDVDNLDFATPVDGVLRLKLANILDETEHVDALSVLAVDHDPGTTVAPDATGTLHTLGVLANPVTARGFDGADALARVRTADGWNWESALRTRDTSRISDIRDGVELTFIRPGNAARAHLVLDGNNTPWAAHLMTEMIRAHGTSTQAWYDTLNTRPDVARRLGGRMAGEAFLGASVLTSAGWTRQGLIWEAGPEAVKRQVLDLDLARVVGDTVRVRLESAPSFWLIDRVAMDFTPERAVTMRDLRPALARDAKGRDVRAQLASIDNEYFTMERGDKAELRFDVPPVPSGQTRSYLLKSNGWYRIHTEVTEAPDVALLQQIENAPFGISKAAVARMNEALKTVTYGGAR